MYKFQDWTFEVQSYMFTVSVSLICRRYLCVCVCLLSRAYLQWTTLGHCVAASFSFPPLAFFLTTETRPVRNMAGRLSLFFAAGTPQFYNQEHFVRRGDNGKTNVPLKA